MKSIHIANRCYGVVNRLLTDIQRNLGCYCPRCRSTIPNTEWTELIPISNLIRFKEIRVTPENKEIIDWFIQWTP
jgi:hypothetical protein